MPALQKILRDVIGHERPQGFTLSARGILGGGHHRSPSMNP
jgi:hypothetical protein